jgi:PKHD-type hydroxylase
MWPSSINVSTILEQPETKKVNQASTFGGENLEYRRSRVAWLTGNQEVQSLLEPYVAEARTIMGINVEFNAEMQFTEYHASEGGKYDWHHDVDWNNNDGTDRKLSLTVQLSDPSDYDGGDFEFSEVEQLPIAAKKQGTVMVFPSYLAHRVTPVTRGVRRSLVAWFSGPTWR